MSSWVDRSEKLCLKEGIPGLKEESSVKNCDFILAFCSVVSKSGTNIEEALKKLQTLSETKPAVLVVLHSTLNPELTVPDSSRSVNRENTLTVDCLFEQDRGLLQCPKNQEALDKITGWIKPLVFVLYFYMYILLHIIQAFPFISTACWITM
uniref:Uncharacterized protein n=1 Tax=Astyanax mexicanus TaxID=7994 RepID=W5LNG0_ASTMX